MRRAPSAAVLLCLLATAAQAAPCDSTAACLEVLKAAQASTQTVDARFVQTKHLSLLDEPLVSTGRFRFRRPDHVRLDVETPQPSTILIAGRSVTIPGLAASEQRALADSPMAAMFTELGAVFAGNLDRAPAHFTVEARGAGDAIEVSLTPTAPDYQRLFRTIALRFAGPQTIIESMRLDDALGDRLDVELRDVRRNVDLPDAVFAQP
jgi:outer membrane lipoprotein-sorting protein